jgi:hypothetical protein
LSFEVTSMVWRAEFPAMDKIVLLRLADFADADGRNVYPSVGRVARECGVSERHAQGVLKKFMTSGVLVLVRAGGGRNRPAEYRIDLVAVKRCIPCGVYEDQTPHIMRGIDEKNPAPGAPFKSETPQATTETPQATTLNPAPGAPNPSESTSNHQAAAAAAHATPEPICETSAHDAHAVGFRVLEIMGVTNDPRWYGNSSRVGSWLHSGADPEADIYPTVTRLMNQRKGEPPRSLKYFDAAIAEAVRDRTATLTAGGPNDTAQHQPRHPGRHRHGGSSPHEALFAGGAAVAAQFRQEGGNRG